MDFFDKAVDTAREAFDIACKKTGEIAKTQKQKFDVASIEHKRSKDFEKLGKFYYEMIKESEIEDVDARLLVESINQKTQKINELKGQINASKNSVVCPECSALNNENAAFCNACGAKLD